VRYRDYMRRCAAEYFAALLVKHDGNVTHAAREAGVNRTALHNKLKSLGFEAKPVSRGNAAWRELQ
jgi:DNA-binding NtrC family response regulator